MRRRDFIAAIIGAAAWPLEARSQQRVRVIGILAMSGPENAPLDTAFRQALGEEGRNVAFEFPRVSEPR